MSAYHPRFRCPRHGAGGDPALLWHAGERAWWLLYTPLRADLNEPDFRPWFGTGVGRATSRDGGLTWQGGELLDLPAPAPGPCTWWAPHAVWAGGALHLFTTWLAGDRNLGSPCRLCHYVSSDGHTWTLDGVLWPDGPPLRDACVLRHGQGWRLYATGAVDGADGTLVLESPDLHAWSAPRALDLGRPHYGPTVIPLGGWWWLLGDTGAGLAVWRSTEGEAWQAQAGLLLDAGGTGWDQGPAAQGDAVVQGDHALLWYSCRPFLGSGAPRHDGCTPPEDLILAINVARLELRGDQLVAQRGLATASMTPG